MALDPTTLVVRKLPSDPLAWGGQRGPQFLTIDGRIITLLTGSLVNVKPTTIPEPAAGFLSVVPRPGDLILDPDEIKGSYPTFKDTVYAAQELYNFFESYDPSPKLTRVEEACEDLPSRFSLIGPPEAT